jgi:simple sugar transport system ATP-binding protein
MATQEPVVVMEDIRKSFGPVRALDGASLKAYGGQVLGILGDNGAGKSTMIKILSGVYKADSGRIIFEGKDVEFASPMDARRIGIETIYQDLAIVNDLSVYHNIFLAREKLWSGLRLMRFLRNGQMASDAVDVLKDVNADIQNVNVKVGTLSGGQRQVVAVARSVFFSAKVLIMDEPTASLGVVETRRVLNLIDSIKARGNIAVILIAHNIQQVMSVADQVIILSRGKVVAGRDVKTSSVDEVINLITTASLGSR